MRTVTSAFPSITTVDTAGTFTIRAKDAAGDVVTNYTGTVTINSATAVFYTLANGGQNSSFGAGTGTINNTNFVNQKVLQTGWIGAKYAITSNLDIAAAYYHEWQNSFATGANTGCTDARNGSCSGSLDAVSLVVDWRFAKHMDMYAGVMWSQVQNGLASGFQQANGTNTGGTIPTGPNKASTFDPGIGMRYQF